MNLPHKRESLENNSLSRESNQVAEEPFIPNPGTIEKQSEEVVRMNRKKLQEGSKRIVSDKKTQLISGCVVSFHQLVRLPKCGRPRYASQMIDSGVRYQEAMVP